MLNKKAVHVWKETLSAKPATRDTFKGMHLAVLHQATRQKLDEHLLHIQFETHDFILCELKGRPTELTAFPLPQKDEGILWLCLQFQGTLSFPTGKLPVYLEKLSFIDKQLAVLPCKVAVSCFHQLLLPGQLPIFFDELPH